MNEELELPSELTVPLDESMRDDVAIRAQEDTTTPNEHNADDNASYGLQESTNIDILDSDYGRKIDFNSSAGLTQTGHSDLYDDEEPQMEEVDEVNDGVEPEILNAADLNVDAHYSEPNNRVTKSPEPKNGSNKSREYNIITHQREGNGTDNHQESWEHGSEVKSGRSKYNIITHTKSSESLLGANDDISPKYGNGDGRDGFAGHKNQYGYPGAKQINKSYDGPPDPKYGNKLNDGLPNDKYARPDYKSPARNGFGNGNGEYGITSYDSKFEYVGSVPSFGAKERDLEYMGGGPKFGAKESNFGHAGRDRDFGAKDNFEFAGPNFGANHGGSPPHALLNQYSKPAPRISRASYAHDPSLDYRPQKPGNGAISELPNQSQYIYVKPSAQSPAVSKYPPGTNYDHPTGPTNSFEQMYSQQNINHLQQQQQQQKIQVQQQQIQQQMQQQQLQQQQLQQLQDQQQQLQQQIQQQQQQHQQQLQQQQQQFQQQLQQQQQQMQQQLQQQLQQQQVNNNVQQSPQKQVYASPVRPLPFNQFKPFDQEGTDFEASPPKFFNDGVQVFGVDEEPRANEKVEDVREFYEVEIRNLKQDLGKQQEAYQKLQDELKNRPDDNSKARLLREGLQRDNIALQELNNQIRDELVAARKAREEAVTQLQAAKTERTNFEIQLRQAEKNFTSTKDSLRALEVQYNDTVTQLKLFEAKLKKREEEAVILQRQMDVKNAELQRAASAIGKLNVEFQDMKIKKAQLEQELQAQMQKSQTDQRNIKQYLLELDLVKKDNQALQYELMTLRKDADHYRDLSDGLRDQISDQEHASKQMIAELEMLRKETTSDKYAKAMWEKEKVTMKETIQSQQREISDLLRTIREVDGKGANHVSPAKPSSTPSVPPPYAPTSDYTPAYPSVSPSRKVNPGMRTSFDLFTGKPLESERSEPETHDHDHYLQKQTPSYPSSYQPPSSHPPSSYPSSSHPSSYQPSSYPPKQVPPSHPPSSSYQPPSYQPSPSQPPSSYQPSSKQNPPSYQMQQQIQQQQQVKQLQQKQMDQKHTEQMTSRNPPPQRPSNPQALSAAEEAHRKRVLDLDRKIKNANVPPDNPKYVRMPYATELSHNEQKLSTDALEHQLMTYCLEKNRLESEYSRMTHPRNHQQLKRKTEVESRIDFLTKEVSRLRMDLREKKVL